jgi:hypothetical protein
MWAHGHTLHICVRFMQIIRTVIFILQSVYWEAVSYSASQNIPCLVWIPIVHYHSHESPPLDIVPSHLYSVSTLTHYFQRLIVMLSSHLWLGLLSGLFPSGFLTKIIL